MRPGQPIWRSEPRRIGIEGAAMGILITQITIVEPLRGGIIAVVCIGIWALAGSIYTVAAGEIFTAVLLIGGGSTPLSPTAIAIQVGFLILLAASLLSSWWANKILAGVAAGTLVIAAVVIAGVSVLATGPQAVGVVIGVAVIAAYGLYRYQLLRLDLIPRADL